MSRAGLFMLLSTIHNPIVLRTSAEEQGKNRGLQRMIYPGTVYFVVRVPPQSLTQQSICSTLIFLRSRVSTGVKCHGAYFKEMTFTASQDSVAIRAGRKSEREQLIHCQSLKLVIHPIWPVDAESLLPCHSLVIVNIGAQTEQ